MRLFLLLCALSLGLTLRVDVSDAERLLLFTPAEADEGGGGDGGDGDGGDGDGGDGDGGDGDGGDGDGGDGDGGDGDDGDGDDDGGNDDDGDDDDDDHDDDDDDNDDDDDAAAVGTQRGMEAGGADRVLAGEIVLLSDRFEQEQRARLSASGFRIISEDALAAFGATITRLATPAGLSEAEALALAENLLPQAVFDVNHVYVPNGAECTGKACWGRQAVGLETLAPEACRDTAPIAVVDTPVAQDHPALAGAEIASRRFLRVGQPPAPPDHATAIAALLVGQPAPGVPPLAPGARLLVAEVFAMTDGGAHADAVSLVRGLDWSVRNGARVIALSIEGARNRTVAFAVRAAARVATLVAAAGNGGPKGAPVYPAAYPEVIAVSAVDARLRPYRQGTRGDYVEISGPGVDIISSAPGAGARSWTGTSFAVPYVAAAMLRALAETGGDQRAARERLARTAKDLGPKGRDDIYGHGLVQSSGSRCR